MAPFFRTMRTNALDESHRLTLLVRDDVPEAAAERQREVKDRLEGLTAGTDYEITVQEWAKRVPLDEDSPELARYGEFAAWADATGVSLAPFFETRECYSWEDGGLYDALVLPIVCLAASDDEGLRTVFPHIDDTVYTVEDALDLLEALVAESPEGKLGPATADD